MKRDTTFLVRLNSLKEGKHNFNFELDNSFFETIDSPSLNGGTVLLDLLVDKSDLMIQLNFSFSGTLNLICDRSLKSFDFPVNNTFNIYYKKGEDFEELSEDLYVIPASSTELVFENQLNDLVFSLIPPKVLHPDFQSENEEDELIFSTEEAFEEENKDEETVDPRWSALQKLKQNNKD